ncbi:23S rRNA (pseudouridine(1915)-N(3))-methyltransferase [Ranunculus cassubicifolius]
MAISCNTNIYCAKNPNHSLRRQCKYSGQSVRAVPIRIITVGKKRSTGIQLLVHCNVNDIQIRSNPKNTSNVNAQIEGEDGAVMQHIRSDDWVVMLDENGLDIGSIEMAELLGDAGNTGSSTLTFCIGGPYGHGKQLRERANVTIKLSSMVLNHQIALVVLMEQLYRAWTILKGQKYHH